ncbi:hypothetical protein GCM10027347_44710 [Larkinella harenae]
MLAGLSKRVTQVPVIAEFANTDASACLHPDGSLCVQRSGSLPAVGQNFLYFQGPTGKYYERFVSDGVYSGEWAGLIGDGIADDTTKLMAASQAVEGKGVLKLFRFKTYKVNQIPCRCDIDGNGATIKLSNSQNSSIFNISAHNVTLTNLVLDYNKAGNTTAGLGKACVYNIGYNGLTLDNVTFINANRNAIYVKNSTDGVIDNCRFINNNGESIFLHGGCKRWTITSNKFKDCLRDYIKIHAHDGVNTNWETRDIIVQRNHLDYSGVVLPTSYNTLAIEVWRGDAFTNSKSENIIISDNIITGSKQPGSAHIWGISMDNTDNFIVSNNIVRDGVKYCYEAAGCQNGEFKGNHGKGYDNRGISISKARTNNIKVEGGFIGNAVGVETVPGVFSYENIYGLEVTAGTQVDIDSVKFDDTGERAIFYNGGGHGATINNPKFSIAHQKGNMTCIYMFNVVGFSITNANAFPNTTLATADFGMPGARIQDCRNWNIKGCTLDGRKAVTLAPLGTTCITVSGNSGRGILSSNWIGSYSVYAIDTTAATSDPIQVKNNYHYQIGNATKFNIRGTDIGD